LVQPQSKFNFKLLFLIDKEISRRQIKAMLKVLSDFIWNKRRPFHILDINPLLENNSEISA